MPNPQKSKCEHNWIYIKPNEGRIGRLYGNYYFCSKCNKEKSND